MVLVDAAKGCATEPPDLSKYPVDFVVISFYKVCGVCVLKFHVKETTTFGCWCLFVFILFLWRYLAIQLDLELSSLEMVSIWFWKCIIFWNYYVICGLKGFSIYHVWSSSHIYLMAWYVFRIHLFFFYFLFYILLPILPESTTLHLQFG